MRYLYIIYIFIFTSILTSVSCDIIKLNQNNFVALRRNINEESASRVISDLIQKTQNIDKIYFYINSPGGSVFSGMKIIDTINSLTEQNIEITCIADFAASMAFSVLQSCPKRYITKSAIVMQHEASLNIGGEMPNLNSRLSLIKRVLDKQSKKEADRIGLSYEEYARKIRDDWWLFSEESVNENIADKLVSVICDFDPVEHTIHEKISNMFFEVELDFSLCPLVSAPVEILFGEHYNRYKEVERIIN